MDYDNKLRRILYSLIVNILQPEIFTLLSKKEVGYGGEIQLTDAMEKLITLQNFNSLHYVGERIDCGSKIGWLEANLAFALDRENLAPQLKNVMQEFVRNS